MEKICFAMVCMALLVTGCTKSSGVMEYGPGVYSVSVDVDSEIYGLGTATKKAYNEAKIFYKSQGKKLSVQTTEGQTNSFGYTNATLVFRCINDDQ